MSVSTYWTTLALLAGLAVPTLAVAQDEAIAAAVVEAVADNDEPAIAQATPDRNIRPLTVAASLVDESTITGTLSNTNSLSIKTAFGAAEIPLSEVAGVRFPRENDTSTTVVMLNGDSITGATDLKFIEVETTWGSAKINGQSIATMLFVPGLAWQSNEVLGGRRWQLVEAARAAQPSSAPATSPLQSTNGSSPIQRIPQSSGGFIIGQ